MDNDPEEKPKRYEMILQDHPDYDILRDAMRHHPELWDAHLTVQLGKLYDIEKGLVLAGYPVAAIARKIGERERAFGMCDAEILIDGPLWDEMEDPEFKVALLDHELQHFDIVYDKETGDPKLDCNDRPRIRMRLHDRQFGWFDDVAKRHGNKSFEVRQASRFVAKEASTYLPGFDVKAANIADIEVELRKVREQQDEAREAAATTGSGVRQNGRKARGRK